ncbi:CheR family methyltransferase [Georgenia thermotolerans]|uniref:protein-glutamate O-methyltransferase n=1 Tax=Georgenia thermotolerans TaxID=527326 RepID=A0A7J5UT96_9MICO|nr:PAS domain-containing protein [Georgenia thermotolerans]
MPENATLEALLRYLKDERGFDFTGYKRASLTRRVMRRMAAVGASSFEEYHDYLLVHPLEFTALFNTILINVTSFFRDVAAWRYLADKIVPDLIAVRVGQPIRVWSAGCASGEEAYSLSMVLAEALGLDELRERVKIYATDVDEEALNYARQGSYTEVEVDAVPPALREKYLEQVGQRFVFRKELRRAVIFGRNDLVQDAPISHVDILACRNTLMYFNAETQSQILSRFHFALRPDGVLFLGKAEMLLTHAAQFRPVELRSRFFRKVPVEVRDRRFLLPQGMDPGAGAELARLRQAALMAALSAQVVLDGRNNVALVNHRATEVFRITTRDVGRPFQDLELSYRPVELRTHVEEAVTTRRPVFLRDVRWSRGGRTEATYDVHITPLADQSGRLGVMITFDDVTPFRQLHKDLEIANLQLETAYEELQSTNEELETTNEELQSTVEELETTNEELQSTNEELETMNEELQSMNDELHVTNEALEEGQEEIGRLNAFMTAVLGSLTSGIAVVGDDLRIMAWNATAEELWGVRTDEALGQHLLNLDIGLPVDELRQPLWNQLTGDGAEPERLVLPAVNRRGRPLQVKVTVSRLSADSEEPSGAIVVMDPAG